MAWYVTRNGRAWRRADVDVAFGIGTDMSDLASTVQNMLGVTATPAGLIAVGAEALNPTHMPPGPDLGIVAVWASHDGKTWRRVGDPSLKLRGLFTEGMGSVVTLGDLLVATGWTTEHGDLDAAVWTSRDGQRWTRVNDPALTRPDDQLPNDVIAAGPGLVMVGNGRWLPRASIRWASRSEYSCALV